MKTIHKYEVPIEDEFVLQLPVEHQLLCVQVQKDTPFLWVLVNDDGSRSRERFSLRGTGHDCSGVAAKNYVATFQIRGGDLVFHLFRNR